MSEQSIIALSTPRGKGAIALIRLSGNNALEIADRISKLPGKKLLKDQPANTIHYGWTLNEQGQKTDQVIFAVMRGPHSFTGEDTVEISCHNNPFIIDSIIQQAIASGARQALPGEFTRQAFENKKLDLIQAEAINELLCAQTETALKKSLAQLEGSLSSWVSQIEQQLLRALAWSEASFDFLEDEGDFGQEIKRYVNDILTTISQIKKTFNTQQQIREGFRIALIGSVNAGKSSLFNRILQQERSIVTEIAGTTRDSVEAGLYRNGNYWTLIDTAGLRQTKDRVEQLGIKRSFDEAHKADIVVLAIDGSRAITPEEAAIYQELFEKHSQKIITVITKSDTPLTHQIAELYPHALKVSSVIGTNCDLLENQIESRISELLEQSNTPFLVNQRQLNLLLTIEQKLIEIDGMLSGTIHYELVSHHLREALEDISQLTGKSVTEAAMDLVFKEFCVGK